MAPTNMGIGRSPPQAGKATKNPLWQHGLRLDEVKLRLVEKFGRRLRPGTLKKLEDALRADLREQFGLPKWEHGRMLHHLLRAMNGDRRSMGGIRGQQGTGPAPPSVPKNPKIKDLLPKIRTAHDLAALKDVIRDGSRRWELVIDAACEKLETLLAGNRTVSHVEAEKAMLLSMWVAFPESKENKHKEKIAEVLQRALPPTGDGATGRLPDDSPIPPGLGDAFRKTVTRHLVVSEILFPFKELAEDLRNNDRWPEAQIVECVLDGLNQDPRADSDGLRPVEADSLTRAQFKVLLELLGDEVFLRRIEGEVWAALAADLAPPDRIEGEVRAALAPNGGLQAAPAPDLAVPDEIKDRIAKLRPWDSLEDAGDLPAQFQGWLNKQFNELNPGLGQQQLDQSKDIGRLVLSATEGRSSKVEDLTAKEALAIVDRIRAWSGQPPVQRNDLY